MQRRFTASSPLLGLNSKISTFAPLKYRISFNILCRHYTLYCLSRDSIHATGIFTFIAQSFLTKASQPRSSHHWLMFSIYTTKIVECVCPPTISETVAVRTMILAQCPRIASITIKLFQNKFYYPFYTLYLKKCIQSALVHQTSPRYMQGEGRWCCYLADQFVLYYLLNLSAPTVTAN